MRRGAGVVAVARPREDGGEALVVRLDGDVEQRSELLDEGRGLVGLCPVLAAQGQREADDDALGLLLADELAETGEPGSVAARSTVQSGRATVPVGSETATPVRADP